MTVLHKVDIDFPLSFVRVPGKRGEIRTLGDNHPPQQLS